jgi:hypothetical protein
MMATDAQSTTIYDYMPDEGVDCWRPVPAHHVRDDIYRIIGEPPDPEDEIWQFMPGQAVRCRQQQLSEGIVLVTYELATI